MKVKTKPCIMCGQTGEITLPGNEAEAAERWAEYKREYNDPNSTSPKRFIQGAFPDISEADREQFISGTHPGCWNEMFPEDD